jgi:hypothetical protein
MTDERHAPSSRWRHDIKNQLGIVLGFSEILLQDLDEAHPSRSDVEEILNAARRAMVLVEEFDEPIEDA